MKLENQECRSKVIAIELRKFAKKQEMSIEQMAKFFSVHRSQMYFVVSLDTTNRKHYASEKMLEAIGYTDTGKREHDRIYKKNDLKSEKP